VLTALKSGQHVIHSLVSHFNDFVMLCLRCVVHAHLLLDMVHTGTMYWLGLFVYSVLPFLLFIIPLVPKLLYRSTRIISLSVSEWLYNIDIGIETLQSR
jgi:hypothetical protein